MIEIPKKGMGGGVRLSEVAYHIVGMYAAQSGLSNKEIASLIIEQAYEQGYIKMKEGKKK